MIVDDGEILKSNYKIILSMKSVVFLNRLLTVSLYLRTQLSKIFFIDSQVVMLTDKVFTHLAERYNGQ